MWVQLGEEELSRKALDQVVVWGKSWRNVLLWYSPNYNVKAKKSWANFRGFLFLGSLQSSNFSSLLYLFVSVEIGFQYQIGGCWQKHTIRLVVTLNQFVINEQHLRLTTFQLSPSFHNTWINILLCLFFHPLLTMLRAGFTFICAPICY